MGWSVTWDLLLKHPTRNLWAYPFSPHSCPHLIALGLAPQAEGRPLNPGWTGAKQVLPNLARLPAFARPFNQEWYEQTIGESDCAFFDLRSSAPESVIAVAHLVERHLVERFAAAPESLRTMDRRLFEELIAEIFYRMGYAVTLTARTRDGGYDLLAVAPKDATVKYLVECKRPDVGNKVSVHPVRELYGVKNAENATAAILATTSYFSPDAHRWAEKCSWNLELRDYDGVVDWLTRAARRE
jgi:hypothetical protein